MKKSDLIRMCDNILTKRTQLRSIWDCYKRPSVQKEKVFYDLIAEVKRYSNFLIYGIYSYNCQTFTFVRIFNIKDNPQVFYFQYITKKYTYTLNLDDISADITVTKR